ncbi:MAG: hypothetical protein WC562_05740 [Dehalococcoidia bacterium]
MTSDVEIISSGIRARLEHSDINVPVLTKEYFDELLGTPVLYYQVSEGEFKMVNPRSACELSLENDKVEIKDLSGKAPNKKSKSLDIIYQFIGHLSYPIKSYCFTYEFIFKGDKTLRPDEWIASKLIKKTEIKEQLGNDISSTEVILRFQRDNVFWNIKFGGYDSQKGDSIRVRFHIHTDAVQLPVKETLAIEFTSAFAEALKYIESFNK